MKISNLQARKIIRINNLLWRCTFYDELITLPSYDLCFVLHTDAKFMNCAMNFKFIDEKEVLNELEIIEKFYSIRNKPSSLYLCNYDEPREFEKIIKNKGYKEIKEEEAIFWGLNINDIKKKDFNIDEFHIKECRTKDDFAEYLIVAHEGYSDFDYTPFASSFSKLFNTNIDGLTQLHFVGYVGDKAVACGTIGIYLDLAVWINAAVIPKYRIKGINTSMLQNAILETNKLGANSFYFCTDVDNIRSIKSGTNIGFSEVIRQRMFSKV